MTTQASPQPAAKTVLLIGATGSLGGMIARELLAQGANLRLLVRSSSRSKVDAEVAAKSEVVDNGPGIFDGVYTVVSAVQGGTGTIVEAQLGWLRAAREAGAPGPGTSPGSGCRRHAESRPGWSRRGRPGRRSSGAGPPCHAGESAGRSACQPARAAWPCPRASARRRARPTPLRARRWG